MSSDWAAPETPADAEGPVARRRPAGVARMDPVSTQAVPVPLRPLSMGEILDGAFETIRLAPGLILGLAALVVVPAELWMSWLDRDLLAGSEWRYVLSRPWRYLVDSGSEGARPSDLSVWITMGLGLVVPSVCGVGIGRVLSAWYAGTPITLGVAAGEMAKRSWVVLLVAPIRGLGSLAFAIPLVFLILTAPVIGIEGAGPGRALNRSWNLVNRRFASALGFYLLSGFLFFVMTLTLNVVPLIFGQLFLGESRWILMVTANIAIAVLLTAFIAAGTSLLYLDSRVRVEGLDLDLMLVDLWPEPRR